MHLIDRPCKKMLVIAALALDLFAARATAAEVLDAGMHHLRAGQEREWAEFPETAEADHLHVTFKAEAEPGEKTLRVRHRDLKQTWTLSLNGKEIGRLPPDENDMVTYWSLPANSLVAGDNTLSIAGSGRASDDVMIGPLWLDHRPRKEVLGESSLQVTVADGDTGEALPCRLTVLDEQGAMMTTGAESDGRLAVRPGLIYTADGKARFTLPAGKYKVYAGRGFEYGVDSTMVELPSGATVEKRLIIRREVPTEGYVNCDTHCHTLTFSRHGDATIEERMITVAAEGLELPIAADHNIQIDYRPHALKAGLSRYFTPVIGNEVTTAQRLGHFNVFPIAVDAPVVDHTGSDWPTLFEAIYSTPGVKVVVLNHARDIHSGYRPFGPKHHVGLTGENLDGWKLRANAMEVVNSSAMQTDGMQLFHDWLGLLNRGLKITPIGSSDSHDVGRHFIAQGRTYIRCKDDDPGNIDVVQACQSLLEGRVAVSLGLLCEMTVNDRYSPGDLVPASDTIDVKLRVLGPSWTRAAHVALYANGTKIREADITASAERSLPLGVKWQGGWELPRPRHDVHLAAVATGPGVDEPFWHTNKPYQPVSLEWDPYVFSSTGAVRIDADGSGRFDCAHDYARRLVEQSGADVAALLNQLGDYDSSVAAQAAGLLRAGGTSLFGNAVTTALKQAPPVARRGFAAYIAAWRESEAARAEP